MTERRVTAIIPTFNQSAYIVEALDSIADQVDELVIVNDGSTDDTRGVIMSWLSPRLVGPGGRIDERGNFLGRIEPCAVHVVHHSENLGTAAAINTGSMAAELYDTWQIQQREAALAESCPEDVAEREAREVQAVVRRDHWVTWISSDNVYSPMWREVLETGIKYATHVDEVDVGVIYSAFRYGIDGEKLYNPYNPDALIRNQNCFFGPSFLVRADVWREVGPVRGRISHDYDHWLRIEEHCWAHELAIIAEPMALCDYRVHDERATVRLKHEYDAGKWQAEARERRAGVTRSR